MQRADGRLGGRDELGEALRAPGEPHEDEMFFDYTTDPPGIPAGWPAFKPNDVGLSRAVYMNMKDYVRRVATGVVVGPYSRSSDGAISLRNARKSVTASAHCSQPAR